MPRYDCGDEGEGATEHECGTMTWAARSLNLRQFFFHQTFPFSLPLLAWWDGMSAMNIFVARSMLVRALGGGALGVLCCGFQCHFPFSTTLQGVVYTYSIPICIACIIVSHAFDAGVTVCCCAGSDTLRLMLE